MYRLIIKMAWASLNRRRSRSYLVVLMIALCLWGLLALDGLYDGMIAQMIKNAIRSGSGQISVFAKGYRLDHDLAKLIDSKGLERLLTSDHRIRSFSERLLQDGLVATAHYARSARIYGVDLRQEKAQGQLDRYLKQGRYSFGRRLGGAILGAKLAEKLKVHIGDKIILSAQDLANEVSSSALKVTGIVKTNTGLDQNAVFIAMDKARRLLAAPRGVSQVLISLNSEARDIYPLQRELEKIGGLEVLRWDEIYPALLQSREMMEKFNLIASFLVFCVAALGIFGVMLVSVLERMREFGIMLALGTEFSRIGWIVMTESFFLGILGFLAGAGLGGGTLYYFHQNGLDLSMFSQGLDAFGMDVVTYAVVRPQYFYLALAAVILATLVSTLLPLRILQKSRPISAIQEI